MRPLATCFAVAAAIIAGLAAAVPSAAPAAGTAAYTTAQAATGAKEYAARCASCHGAKLQGMDGPALKGPDSPITGIRTVGYVYNFVRAQMPLDKPGSLSPPTYAAIVAYLMQQNRHPAGAHALTPAAAAHSTEKM